MALTGAAFVVACGRLTPASGTNPSGEASRSASPTASQEFHPGPDSLSGRVVRLLPSGVVVESAGREVEVSLASVVDVWKETSVPASAIEIGDALFVNGTLGSPFVARYVSANIGRIDGVIRTLDATGMVVEVHLRTGAIVSQRIDFSPYIEYGAADGSVKLTRAELVVDRTIGVVVYGRPGETLRATRIW